MPWFKVDDKLHDHRKARAARKAAMGVWVLAGSWSSDNKTGGFVPESVLDRWGSLADAKRLVDVGFWFPDNQDGENGWRFHNWDLRNPDSASINAKKDAESQGGTLGNHKRWHEKRKLNVPGCSFCASGNASGPIGSPDSPPNPPVPIPSRPEPEIGSRRSNQSRAEVDDDGLTRIQELTKGTKTHARKCVEFVLSKTSNDIKNPTAYVLKAIREDPDAYRYKRGNPKKGEECPTHAGQWADACAGCAADLKASK